MTLKKLIENQQTKQDYIATQLGVKQQTISSWCSGRTEPKITYLLKLAKVLNCNLECVAFAILETQKQKEL